MSAISSMGGGASSAQVLQHARRLGAPGQGGTEFAARMKADFESAARSAGVKDEDIEGLMKQVQEAASSASGSGDREAVKNAVDTVLQKNGADMDKFHAAMEANRPKGGHGPRGAGGPPPSGGPGGAGAAQSSSSSSSSQIQELLKQLQSGESSDTDQSDLVSLLKQLTGESGGLVDVAA